MGRYLAAKHHSELGSNPLQCNVYQERSERSLAASLRTIVRRVLRTKIGRTHFELRILDEARRLLESHCPDTSRDALTKLIVDVVDAAANHAVWQGFAAKTFYDEDRINYDRLRSKIDKIISKMFRDFPPKPGS